MKLILDSHILLAFTLQRTDGLDPRIGQMMAGDDVRLWASVASL